MRKVWTIARHEYLTNLKRPGFIIWTLIVPALGIVGLVIAAFFGGQASQFLSAQFDTGASRIGVVDQAGIATPILPQYEDQFIPYESREAGRADLAAKRIDSLVVIPPDYVDQGDVTVVTRGGNVDFQSADQVENFLLASLLHGRVDERITNRALHPFNPVTVSLDEEAGGTGGVGGMIFDFLAPYFLGVLLVLTIFTSSGYLMRGVAEEKASRVIEVVLSSVTAWQLLAGKVLGLGALGLTQMTVWISSMLALSGGAVALLGLAAPLAGRVGLIALSVVYYLLGFLIYAVLMGAGGSLGTNQQESQQIAGMFSFMAAIPMMLAGFIMANPNATIARVLSWFPLTSPTMMMIRLSLGEIPAVDIVGSIVVTTLTVPVVVWAGAKLFRAGLLMYGSKPSLGEVVKILREA